MMHQGRYISSALLLLFASIMAGFVAPPVSALDLHQANSEDEALKHCKQETEIRTNSNTAGTVYNSYALYPDQQGSDVFYNCGYERVEKTGVNRSKKDCKSASMTYKDTPVRGVRYKCNWDGRWILMDCSIVCRPINREDTDPVIPALLKLRELALKFRDVTGF